MKPKSIIFYVLICIVVYLCLPVTYQSKFVCHNTNPEAGCAALYSSTVRRPTYALIYGLLSGENLVIIDRETVPSLIKNAAIESVVAVGLVFVVKAFKKKRQ